MGTGGTGTGGGAGVGAVAVAVASAVAGASAGAGMGAGASVDVDVGAGASASAVGKLGPAKWKGVRGLEEDDSDSVESDDDGREGKRMEMAVSDVRGAVGKYAGRGK